MKTYIIQSPCYKANGLNGSYYSIAFTDEEGNIIDGFGDHIYPSSKVKNVKSSQGDTFSDDDRFITATESEVSYDDFKAWRDNYLSAEKKRQEWFAEREAKFGDLHDFLYTGSKKQQEDNAKIYDAWRASNDMPRAVDYYGFLKLSK